MSLYLDTSLIVAALCAEDSTPRVQAWLARQTPGDLYVSHWTRTELSSALALKVRSGRIGVIDRDGALGAFEHMALASLTVLPVDEQCFAAAARFVDRHELGLRAGDALHLAIAAEAGAALITLDRRLANAGAALKVPTQLFA